MTKSLEEIKWEEHRKKYDILLKEGIKNGLINAYDDTLIEKLRHIYCGGIPATILLLYGKLSNGHCYDRSRLITLGFEEDDFKVITADIDSLKLNPTYIDEYRKC